MQAWLTTATEVSILVINAMALVFVVIATVEAFVKGLRAMMSEPPPADDGDTRRTGFAG